MTDDEKEKIKTKLWNEMRVIGDPLRWMFNKIANHELRMRELEQGPAEKPRRRRT